MVYDHRKIARLATRLQELDPLSPVRLARTRVEFVYMAATLLILSELMGQPIGNIAKATQHDYATVLIGPKAYDFGWKVDPLASWPPAVRLRRACYALGFLVRDRDPAFLLWATLILLAPLVLWGLFH